jgi:SAM-dependent methyltransferase
MKFFKHILNTVPRPWLIKASYLVIPLITWYLKGDNFTDPIDGKSFKKMLPYGYNNQRKNALSPSTFSLERHRLMWLFLRDQTSFFTAETKLKVLHIAPEQCFIDIFKKQKNLHYITSDLESPIADVKADICNLPFRENEFDVIFCNHVLEHIADDTKAMQELYRVLKSGGFGIFQVPQDLNRSTTFEDNSVIDKRERAKIFGQYDHVRIYGRDYFDKLKAIGFQVDEVDYTKKIAREQLNRFCIMPNEILPVCYKL